MAFELSRITYRSRDELVKRAHAVLRHKAAGEMVQEIEAEFDRLADRLERELQELLDLESLLPNEADELNNLDEAEGAA